MRLPCSYCNEAWIEESDLPCDCPGCGRRLTRVIFGHPQWLQDIIEEEDRIVIAMLEQAARSAP